MKKRLLFGLFLLLSISCLAGVVEDSGVKGGIVVKLGIADPRNLSKLRVNYRYIVQCLDTDAEKVQTAREYVRGLGLYGKITVERYDGINLPYVDNLVNLVIADDKSTVPHQEIMRVLVPSGILLQGGHKTIKPLPNNIDEWTHFLHGPDNNAVANDTVIDKPRSIQWVAYPKWSRSHEQLASMSDAVTSHGRMFAIMDEAPDASIRFMGNWKLVARDAFNGTLLWKRGISVWSDHLRHFRAGPVALPRRLVAVGDKVYVTLGLGSPLSVLDAATGKTFSVLKGTEFTEEIIVDKDVAYLVVGTSEIYREGHNQGFYERGEPKPSGFRFITAINLENGNVLWKKDFSTGPYLLPLTLTVRGESVYYQDTKGIGRLSAKTGQDIWRTDRSSLAKRMSFSAPTVVATDKVLLCADRDVGDESDLLPATGVKVEWGINGWNEPGFSRKGKSTLVAYSVQDGKKIWSRPCTEGFNSPTDIFVINGVVYINGGKAFSAFDLQTGKSIDMNNMSSDRVGMPHHRCYRDKATLKYLLKGHSGIELFSLKDGWVGNNSWIRGTCAYGIIPANGLLYAPPDACGCFNKVRLQGFFAAAPERKKRPLSMNERFEKGPAYSSIGDKSVAASTAEQIDDWPMHRHDIARSGSCKTTISDSVMKIWSTKLSGRLTQPVIVNGVVYVAEIDSHTVHALNADNGSEKWDYIAGGRIDSPPSIYKGTVLFGSADGWVYCLRASDGELAWRFMVAPESRIVNAYNQLESAWPVHGAVLVQNDALYVAAGRNSYLDDGMPFYKLDPRTGKILSKSTIVSRDPVTDKQKAPEASFDMEGLNYDILSGDGQNVFMKQKRFNADCQECDKTVPHLFGIHGFLCEEWFVRSYWLIASNVRSGWGGWASGGSDEFGRILSFDDNNVYGYGRTFIKAGPVGHTADTYHLFGVKKFLPKGTAEKNASKKGNKTANKKRAGVEKSSSKPEPFWSNTDTLIVRAMALTSDKVVVAGPPDLRKKASNIMAYTNEKEALASFMGKDGVLMRVVSAADGTTLSEEKLDAMPVFDGLSTAEGKVFVSLKNGTVECWH